MYVDSSTIRVKGRRYTRHLLRESYREDGKVKKRTIGNISHCSEEEIAAIKLALQHKKDLAVLAPVSEAVSLRQGLSVGAVWLVYDMARQLGIAKALGPSREGKLGLWQVIARVMDQGSRLSAVRLAGSHAACDVVGLKAFNEDDLYANLDWLCTHQARIADTAKLDGCCVLKTDLKKEAVRKEVVHARYKDLTLVERAFRTSKTVELEMRPVNVPRESSTRGHAFVVMLAYRIVHELAQRWRALDLTVEEGIKQLTTLCATEVLMEGQPRCHKIPKPRPSVRSLLKAAKVRLPDALPCSGIRVSTRKKLTEQRRSR